MKPARLLALFPLLALAGCNSAPQPATNSATASSGGDAATFKVGLITPGDVNDHGWNQLAYEGLQGLDPKAYSTTHVVAKTSADQPAAMRQMADDGTNLIFCHGFEFGEPAKTLGPKYPDTDFVVVAGEAHQDPNVACLVPKLDDGTYLLGIAAAGLTKSKKIGMIGGQEIPTVKSAFDAFADGVHSVDKSITVTAKYVGDWEDQNKGKELANNLIASGCDVMIQNADQAGNGMFAAAKEAKAAGKTVYVFGTNRDQNDVLPDLTVGSAVIDLPKTFAEVAKSVQDKTFKGVAIELNLKNGEIAASWNPALKSKIPAAIMKKVDDAAAQIKAGKLETQHKA
jgi:basic membrane lipoprotein Med (substrate-binding protein (PBP1-ABC) superfamily)